MEDFIRIIAEEILKIFLNKSKRDFQNLKENNIIFENIQNLKNKEKIKIHISLYPKTSNFNKKFRVFTIIFFLKKKKKNSLQKKFIDFANVLLDNKNSLSMKIKFLRKNLLSYCILSPFINFFNNDNCDKIKLIKKNYFLDFKIKYEKCYLKNKSKNDKNVFFKKVFENSDFIFEINMSLKKNLDDIIFYLKSKKKRYLNISDKNLETFYHENKKRKSARFSYNFKTQNSNSSFEKLIIEKPYFLLREKKSNFSLKEKKPNIFFNQEKKEFLSNKKGFEFLSKEKNCDFSLNKKKVNFLLNEEKDNFLVREEKPYFILRNKIKENSYQNLNQKKKEKKIDNFENKIKIVKKDSFFSNISISLIKQKNEDFEEFRENEKFENDSSVENLYHILKTIKKKFLTTKNFNSFISTSTYCSKNKKYAVRFVY